MAYMTVGNLVTQARTLLQDDAGDRWSDAKIYGSLNMGLLEARRVRPDFYRDTLEFIPRYDPTTDVNEPVSFPVEFIPALINFMVGYTQLIDDEATSDARATVFLNTFTAKLTQPVA